jgi:hypothetical protein
VISFGLARQAGRTSPAFGRVERGGAILDDNTSVFVAENRGEQSFRISAGQGELVGVTDHGRADFAHDLASAPARQVLE